MTPILFQSLANVWLIRDLHNLLVSRGISPPAFQVLMSFLYSVGQRQELIRQKLAGIITSLFLDAQTFSINPGGRNPGYDFYNDYADCVTHVTGIHADIVSSYDIDFSSPRKCQTYHLRLLRAVGEMKGADGTLLRDRIMPVIHDHTAPEAEFLLYQGLGAKRIAIGSTVPLSEQQWRGLNRLRRKFHMPIHIFGNLDMELLQKRLPESADSCRYASVTKYSGPTILYWDNDQRKQLRLDLSTRHAFTPAQTAWFGDTFGFTRQDLYDKLEYRWMVNLVATCQMERYLADKYYPAHTIDEQGNVVSIGGSTV